MTIRTNIAFLNHKNVLDALRAMLAMDNEFAAVAALEAMFTVHEPEGRFQPSYFKPPLLLGRLALATHYGITEQEMTERLAKLWQTAQRKREEAVNEAPNGRQLLWGKPAPDGYLGMEQGRSGICILWGKHNGISWIELRHDDGKLVHREERPEPKENHT